MNKIFFKKNKLFKNYVSVIICIEPNMMILNNYKICELFVKEFYNNFVKLNNIFIIL